MLNGLIHKSDDGSIEIKKKFLISIKDYYSPPAKEDPKAVPPVKGDFKIIMQQQDNVHLEFWRSAADIESYDLIDYKRDREGRIQKSYLFLHRKAFWSISNLPGPAVKETDEEFFTSLRKCFSYIKNK